MIIPNIWEKSSKPPTRQILNQPTYVTFRVVLLQGAERQMIHRVDHSGQAQNSHISCRAGCMVQPWSIQNADGSIRSKRMWMAGGQYFFGCFGVGEMLFWGTTLDIIDILSYNSLCFDKMTFCGIILPKIESKKTRKQVHSNTPGKILGS